MTQTIKLQHYVPRSYLDLFAVRPKKHSLWCYDKTKRQSFVVSNRNVASEGYFNDTPEQEQQELEAAFSQMEGSFMSVLRKLLASQDLRCLGSNDKVTVASFVVAQELRTREAREQIKDMGKQARDRLSRENLEFWGHHT